ncbi:hypothetical protein O7632_17540 [Solwaraspora sp. WMMD406]|uniref:hypothetical protein n=1 Tax=Solwaraspora sp. WMMD406 TaxID=3016095 RepID=UPI00241644F3|nr:hypothetical protein [Solwaraspora sp. WMMD406]MDG4765889.1 hypothetical protein [Solwaraspora sp. WMMD406]
MYATNDIDAGHIDIVNIECPSSPTLALTTKIGSGTPINPVDMHNYAFVYDDSSTAVTWMPTTGTAGYWSIDIGSATQSSAPWVGFNFEGSCPGSGAVWMSAAGANAGDVRLFNAAGSQVLGTGSGTYPLGSGAHTHFEWRFYAPSKATTPQIYNLYFGFSASAPLSTQNWLAAKFVIIP